MRKIKFIDLFAGLGGIRIGFEQALKKYEFEPECVFTSEIKPYAVDAYGKYFNEKNIYGDITKIPSEKIGYFDFLLAGFPCQAFSTAGKGLGFADARGTLFFEIERLLKYWQPTGFLLENVDGLFNHDKGRTLDVILHKLHDSGYIVSYKILDGKDFGLAQSRKRIYIVGTKNAEINLRNFSPKAAVLKDILESSLPTNDTAFSRALLSHYKPHELLGKSIKDKRGGTNNIHSWDIGLKGEVSSEQKKLLKSLLRERRKKHWAEQIGIKWMDGMPLTAKQISTFYECENLEYLLEDLVKKGYIVKEHPKKLENGKRIQDVTKPKGYNIVAGKLSFEFTKILDPNDIAPTLVAMDVDKLGVVDGNGVRKLCIREGMRLFGFPENYDLSFLNAKDAYDLLGNTVCIPVIEAVASRLCETICKESFEEAEDETLISAINYWFVKTE